MTLWSLDELPPILPDRCQCLCTQIRRLNRTTGLPRPTHGAPSAEKKARRSEFFFFLPSFCRLPSSATRNQSSNPTSPRHTKPFGGTERTKEMQKKKRESSSRRGDGVRGRRTLVREEQKKRRRKSMRNKQVFFPFSNAPDKEENENTPA